jgi:hypothetical protein
VLDDDDDGGDDYNNNNNRYNNSIHLFKCLTNTRKLITGEFCKEHKIQESTDSRVKRD